MLETNSTAPESAASLVPPAIASLTATESEVTSFRAIADVKPVENAAIRPFRVDVSEEALTELRRRIKATRLPEKETVADFSQGVQLAFIQALARIGRRTTTGGDARRN